jgi:branched-chain amino acid transport system ATP-binding protein
LLRVSNLNVAYDGIRVLWDVSLEVEDGRIVALLGPNGAGKTTLLKSIMGLLQIMSGRVEFEGKIISNLHPSRITEMGISYVPEGRGVFPYMTVRENLELGAMSKRSRKLMKENLRTCYELFPILKEREKQLAGTLSGGEMQMLAIARGLMASPRLLMVDEASLGLAPVIVIKLFDALKKINARGVTILLVEQNVLQALDVAHKAYVLESGKIVLEGDTASLKGHEHIKKAYLGL